MRRKTFRQTKKSILDAAIKTIGKMDGRIVYKNLAQGKIKADLPGSFLSYGHEVTLSVKPTIDKRNSLSVTSKTTGIQIIDWGTNSKNEQIIINKINSLLK